MLYFLKMNSIRILPSVIRVFWKAEMRIMKTRLKMIATMKRKLLLSFRVHHQIIYHGNDALIKSHPLETVIKQETVELNINENEKVKKNSIPELVGKEEIEESKSSSLLEKEIPSRKVSRGREFLNI